ncbi:MAG: carbonic anhydrase [Chlamydiales bacterium]|nr:carbonic anhydrase [Chlamydiales bacterium]
MEKLVNGILEFRQNLLSTYREKFAHLALGQFPDTLFIACSDSRVVPNLFASTNPGDLFVLRNVGNLIPPFATAINNATAEAAAIEFSLTNLPIENIIVCGHSECGAMQAILAGTDKIESPSLKSWLENCCCSHEQLATENGVKADLAPHNQLSQMNILQQMDHLRTYPIIQEKLKSGTLNIHGWYFDIATGDVYAYEEAFKRFIIIDETEAFQIIQRLNR